MLLVPCVHRYAGVIESSSRDFCHHTNRFRDGMAMYLNQDLQMLRLFETFSESAPQFTLMMTIILQTEMELITGLSQIKNTLFLSDSIS